MKHSLVNSLTHRKSVSILFIFENLCDYINIVLLFDG